MLNALEQLLAWASIMAIECEKMEGSPKIEEDPKLKFAQSLAKILTDLRIIFQEKGRSDAFREITERHLSEMAGENRKTAPDHILGAPESPYSSATAPNSSAARAFKKECAPTVVLGAESENNPEVYDRKTVPRVGSTPLIQTFQFDDTVDASSAPASHAPKLPKIPRAPRTPDIRIPSQNSEIYEKNALIHQQRTWLKLAIIGAVMTGAGVHLGAGIIWTTDKINAASASAPASGPPAPRARNSMDRVKKTRYEVAANRRLDAYIDQFCQQGPQILCTTLAAAKERTITESYEYESYESTDLHLKSAFLNNLEAAVHNQETGTRRSKEAALEYIEAQRKHLKSYSRQRKWTSEEAARLLKNVQPKEVTQPENRSLR